MRPRAAGPSQEVVELGDAAGVAALAHLAQQPNAAELGPRGHALAQVGAVRTEQRGPRQARRVLRHHQAARDVLRTVLRSWPVRSAIADTDRPCWCNSRIIIHPFRLTTRPPACRATQGRRCSGQAPKRSRASARLRFKDQTGEYSTGGIGEYSSGGDSYRWAKSKRLSPKGFRSPTLGVQRLEEAIRRVEISAEKIEALKARALAVRDRRFGAFVHLLIDTGARKCELLERYWRDIDLDAGTIVCEVTKTGVPRVLHFRPETAGVVRRAWKAMPADRLVFEGRVPGCPVSYRTAWTTVTEEIGLPELHMHDLRHAAAADLLRSGVTLGVAAQVLGHSPQVLSRRYGHLETAALRQAQEQRWKAAP